MLKPLLKSRTARSLLAAGCVAGSPGCVGGPKPRPPPEDCPPGAVETHERLGLESTHGINLVLPLTRAVAVVSVQDGPVIAEIIGRWGGLPDRTIFSGRVVIGEKRVYGRFTEARLPSGETVPVCLQMKTVSDPTLGVVMEPGSTAKRARVISSVSVRAVRRFD